PQGNAQMHVPVLFYPNVNRLEKARCFRRHLARLNRWKASNYNAASWVRDSELEDDGTSRRRKRLVASISELYLIGRKAPGQAFPNGDELQYLRLGFPRDLNL